MINMRILTPEGSMNDARIEEALARDQVRAISAFYNHFIAFAAVIAVLVCINLATGSTFWVHWVVLGWGIGIAAHAYSVFVKKPQRLAELRARHVAPAAKQS
jgi:hypothetical protein